MTTRFCTLLITLLCCFSSALAVKNVADLDLEFRVSNSELDPGFADNAQQIDNFLAELRHILDASGNSESRPVYVILRGTTSLEGSHEFNKQLGQLRRATLERFINDRIVIPDSIIVRNDDFLPWDWFKKAVLKSNIPNKERVAAIANEDGHLVSYGNGNQHIDSRIVKLQQLDGGRVWNQLLAEIFPHMRRAQAILTFERPDEHWPVADVEPEPQVEPQPEPEQVVIVEETYQEAVYVEPQATECDEGCFRKMYIKSNIPAWALLWQNLAIEVDLAKHWSFALPVYWSPYDYGKQTLKFRTLAFVPEFRYWPKADNTGLFINAHVGVAYYNYAGKGEFRYQDHDGKTPAIGGGLGLGYRFYFCNNRHWTMEAAVGAGIYQLDYDIFLNTDRTSLGPLVGRKKRTFYGIDQAAFTISYSFGLNKKGGEK